MILSKKNCVGLNFTIFSTFPAGVISAYHNIKSSNVTMITITNNECMINNGDSSESCALPGGGLGRVVGGCTGHLQNVFV